MRYRTDKLVIDTRTDTQTDRRRQRQYPKAKTGLGLKKPEDSNKHIEVSSWYYIYASVNRATIHCLFSVKPLPEPLLIYFPFSDAKTLGSTSIRYQCPIDIDPSVFVTLVRPEGTDFSEIQSKYETLLNEMLWSTYKTWVIFFRLKYVNNNLNLIRWITCLPILNSHIGLLIKE